jgi:hypothetical protein
MSSLPLCPKCGTHQPGIYIARGRGSTKLSGVVCKADGFVPTVEEQVVMLERKMDGGAK